MSSTVAEMEAAVLAGTYTSAMDCHICMNTMDDNIYLCENGHSFCSTCKTNMQETCPQCRSNLTNSRNYQLEQLIKEMKLLHELYLAIGIVDCCFNEYGCDERMDVKSILEHEKECQKRVMHCTFANEGCRELSSRETIQIHERTCQFRTVPCVHDCGEDVPVRQLVIHNTFCEHGEYTCRFKKNGCFKIMKFYQLSDHEVECSHRTVHCTYSKSGCSEIGMPKEIEEHETNCPFRTTACSFSKNGCEAVVLLSEKDYHESVCRFQKMKCIFAKEGCLEAGKTEDIQQHISSCKFRTLPCSFKEKGCNVALVLAELEMHELLCEFRSINCIFSTSGCAEILKASELEAHEKKCKYLSRRINLTNFSDMPLRCKGCKVIFNSEVFFVPVTTGIYCFECSQKFKFGGVYRSIEYETLIKEIEKRFFLPCMYNYNGCDRYLDLKDKTDHEIECQFRDVLCKISPCNWKGKIELLSTHALIHDNLQQMILKDNKYYSNEVSEDIQKKEMLIVMLKADDELFSCTLQKQNNEIYWAVQLIGQTSVANKYKYKIKILKATQKLIGMEMCESDSKNLWILITKKRCVSFPYNIVENFTVDGKLNFMVVIKKESP